MRGIVTYLLGDYPGHMCVHRIGLVKGGPEKFPRRYL